MFNSRLIIAIAAIALGGCAGSPDYVAADDPQGRGYFSQRLGADHYRVHYNGGRRSGLEETRDFTLLRAAEVTLREGYDWFSIVDRDTHTRTRHTPRTGFGYERAYYVDRDCGLLYCSSRVRPASYARWQISNDRHDESHSHSIEVKLGKGTLPSDGRSYDARSILASIRTER